MALRGEQEDVRIRPGTQLFERTSATLRAAKRTIAEGYANLPEPPKRLRTLASQCRIGGPVHVAISDWFYRQPVVRFISANMLRKIMASNLLGFVILFGGILYLNQNSGWLINAKREALRVQGEIIAAAIASGAKVERGGHIILDTDNLPTGADALAPFSDDGFSKLEHSIGPERIAPILKRLTRPTNTRGRVYDREGDLVIDTNWLLTRGSLAEESARKDKSRPKTKNFWTRLRHWLIGREVQVYKEIGSANGKYYPEVRMALEGKPEGMLLLDKGGEQIVSMAVPIRRTKSILGVLLLSTPPGEIDAILAEERSAIWPLAALALLASIITSFILARTVAGPMKRLAKVSEIVRRDINTHSELPDYSDRKDEVGMLAGALRAMTQALYRRIEASEKFAADVAHELKNPLTAASSTAQSLEYAKTEEQRHQLVEQIQLELKRLNRLISDVSSASRLDAELARQSQSTVSMRSILESVNTIFEDKADERHCTLILDLPQRAKPNDFMVSGNEGRLAQVLTNLVDNAVSFSQPGTTVTVTGRRNGDWVIVSIEDEGPGIDEDKLKTVFERFYTYRPDDESSRGDNSGLGLSISKEIIEAHGGEIWAENRIEPSDELNRDSQDKRLGARFVVKLPAIRAV